MGRARLYGSDAERQAAYRQRRYQEAQAVWQAEQLAREDLDRRRMTLPSDLFAQLQRAAGHEVASYAIRVLRAHATELDNALERTRARSSRDEAGEVTLRDPSRRSRAEEQKAQLPLPDRSTAAGSQVACPKCDAPAGWRCTGRREIHSERLSLVARSPRVPSAPSARRKRCPDCEELECVCMALERGPGRPR